LRRPAHRELKKLLWNRSRPNRHRPASTTDRGGRGATRHFARFARAPVRGLSC
jgi:hypothetical protein